ncbi:MAG: 3-oxoacyl-ACP reductase FabG [Succinivibrionaceae bacterium]|nr:3-oxoacyl-ACP reductase FabG [Succinivibrionaceae bacterium]
MDFSGKIAVVTGASRGIGREIAEELRKAGADVFGTATSEKGAAGISEYLGEGRGLVLNVADQASVDAFAGKVKGVGDPDILVNNAGITRDGLLMRMKDSDWDDVINTNLSSVYRMSKAFLRGMMKKRYGRIVSVSSVVGLMGNAGQTNYAAAKAGIIGFTRSLAKEVASRGITVNAVAPGFIATDMTAALTDEQKQKISAEIPSGRLGSAADIANAVLFLASDASSYITGDVINVNGGMYMA